MKESACSISFAGRGCRAVKVTSYCGYWGCYGYGYYGDFIFAKKDNTGYDI